MIRVGDNPNTRYMGKGSNSKIINKYIDEKGEGLRGKLVAISKDKTEAIIICLTNSIEGRSGWGKLYLIREYDEDNYPTLVKGVKGIPQEEKWDLVGFKGDEF